MSYTQHLPLHCQPRADHPTTPTTHTGVVDMPGAPGLAFVGPGWPPPRPARGHSVPPPPNGARRLAAESSEKVCSPTYPTPAPAPRNVASRQTTMSGGTHIGQDNWPAAAKVRHVLPTQYTSPTPNNPNHWTDWTLGMTALGKGPTPVKPYWPDHGQERGQSPGEAGEVEGPR